MNLGIDGPKAAIVAIDLHRIKYLEMLYDYILGHKDVAMWTGAEILDWYKAQIR